MMKNNKGYSAVEFVFVMGLLLLFTFGSLLLIKDGSDLYKNIIDRKDAQTDIRIATAYINNKLRQNDVSGAIRLEEIPGGSTAIVVSEMVSGVFYDTWVFSMDGYLKEALVQSNQEMDVKESFEIVKLDALTVTMLENATMQIDLMDDKNNKVQLVYKIKSGN